MVIGEFTAVAAESLQLFFSNSTTASKVGERERKRTKVKCTKDFALYETKFDCHSILAISIR